MSRALQISDAEWVVMKALWARSPRGAGEIAEDVSSQTGWKLTTVKTLLNRLVAKKAVGYSVQGKAYLYRPLVTQAECVRSETRSFLRRVFDGSLTPMVAHFVEQKSLTPEQIQELKALLAKAEQEHKQREERR
jgi:BlaI family transcriptional regulator, penicillinase repressor